MPHIGDRQAGDVGDAPALARGCPQTHRTRRGVQAGAFAAGAGHVGQVFDFGLGKGLLAAFVLVVLHRVVEHLTLVFAELDAGAHAIWAPAMFAVVREQTRIEFGIRGGTRRACAQCRKHAVLADAGGGLAAEHGFAQAVQIAQDMHHAFAVLQRFGQGLAQSGFVARQHIQTGHRQLDVVFLEAVNARETLCRQKVAIHTQVGVATRPRPIGELGVNTFAVDDQRSQQADVLAFELRHQLRNDAVGRLRLDGRVVVHAMLNAQLHIEQAQKVPDLGGGAHGGFATAA